MMTVGVEEVWTLDKLKQEVYLDLMKIRSGQIERKYEDQAKDLIHKIPVYKPIPNFIVNLADVSDRVKIELSSLDSKPLNDVMKEAIGRIFENIEERYFLLNVKKLLKWELLQ